MHDFLTRSKGYTTMGSLNGVYHTHRLVLAGNRGILTSEGFAPSRVSQMEEKKDFSGSFCMENSEVSIIREDTKGIGTVLF